MNRKALEQFAAQLRGAIKLAQIPPKNDMTPPKENVVPPKDTYNIPPASKEEILKQRQELSRPPAPKKNTTQQAENAKARSLFDSL